MNAQPVLPTPDASPGLCICGRPLPVRKPPCSPAKDCCYWHALVRKGVFTLAEVEPMVPTFAEIGVRS